MSATYKLLPCPFCGGEARPMAQHWDDGSHVWWVECRVCGAEAKRCDDGLEAIAAWNTRAERTCRNVHEPPKDSTFWPAPHFKCSECGAVHVSVDYVFYCPNCGARVEVAE